MSSREPVVLKRADAERNRGRILAAAREAFDGEGAEPSLAEITRRAGVSMATLYRNFPGGRLELVSALYETRVDDICGAATEVTGETAGEVFFAWLERFHAAGAGKGPLASLLLAEPGAGSAVINRSRERVFAAGQPLFEAAQLSGEVRDDVPLPQVLDAIVAVGQIADGMVQVLFDGLRTSRP